jgi:hypothetical protein
MVFYKASYSLGVFCSDTVNINTYDVLSIIEGIRPIELNEENVTKLYRTLVYMITGELENPQPPQLPMNIQQFSMITKAAYVAKNYLGLDWYLIPSESP